MPKKKSYKVGDACKELDIQPYVLRYWETEFPFLRPEKGSSGPRTYSEDELTLIRRIKELLYDEGYTIAGAKKKLEGELESGGPRVKSGQRSLADAGDDSPGAADAGAGAAASAAPDEAAEADPPSLDTAASERIETIARGLRSLRDEAREVLELLRGSPDR